MSEQPALSELWEALTADMSEPERKIATTLLKAQVVFTAELLEAATEEKPPESRLTAP